MRDKLTSWNSSKSSSERQACIGRLEGRLVNLTLPPGTLVREVQYNNYLDSMAIKVVIIGNQPKTCPNCKDGQQPDTVGLSYCLTCSVIIEDPQDHQHGTFESHLQVYGLCRACLGTGKVEDAMRRRMQGFW